MYWSHDSIEDETKLCYMNHGNGPEKEEKKIFYLFISLHALCFSLATPS